MSTRCQIEFRRGNVRRTVYRHWDGYPSAVLPDLLAFLQWSTRGGDIEYETANFLYWSKHGLGDRSVQLGFGVCANDELHGDVEYYYVVEHTTAGTVVRAYTVEHDQAPKVGRLVQEVAVPQPLSSSSFPARSMQPLPRVEIAGIWYFRNDRLREYRRCDTRTSGSRSTKWSRPHSGWLWTPAIARLSTRGRRTSRRPGSRASQGLK